MKPGAVLMAAGNASRFGENKLLLPVDGRPAVEWAMLALREGEFSAVAVVTQYPEVMALAEQYGFLPVENPDPGAGVSLTIRLGLTALLEREPDLPGCLFAVGDQPRLRGTSVKALVRAWEEEPGHIMAMSFAGKRGNPVLFPAVCFPALMALTGDVGGSAVIRENENILRLFEAADPKELMDGDTPEDWKELLG